MLATLDLRALGHNSPRYIHAGHRGAQARVRRPRALLRRGADAPARRAALARLRAGSGPRSSARTARCPRRRRPAIRAAAGSRAGRGSAGARGTPSRPAGADGTTHIAAIDRDGNMVCLTPSGGVFRKSAFAPELGLHAQHSQRDVRPRGRPSERRCVPGKRPRTTLVSYLICEGGVPDHDRRLPGRRRPGAGRSAARPELCSCSA